MICYKSLRLIDGKHRWVVVDHRGEITNRNPNKKELKGLKEEKYVRNIDPYVKYTDNELLERMKRFYEENGRIPMQTDFANNPNYPHYATYRIRFGSWDKSLDLAGLWEKRHNETNTCDRCGKSFEKVKPVREYDKEGRWTGKWDCVSCYEMYDPNSTSNTIRLMTNCRTGYPNSECATAEGDLNIELVCELYEYIDLNKKYDKYNNEIDCQDPKTGLFYEVKGKLYSSTYRRWDFSNLGRGWQKIYEDIILVCKSKDGNSIERMYRIPFNEIYNSDTGEGRTIISIYNDPRDSRGNPKTSWYEQYRITDEETIRKANEILKKIIKDKRQREELIHTTL